MIIRLALNLSVRKASTTCPHNIAAFQPDTLAGIRLSHLHEPELHARCPTSTLSRFLRSLFRVHADPVGVLYGARPHTSGVSGDNVKMVLPIVPVVRNTVAVTIWPPAGSPQVVEPAWMR